MLQSQKEIYIILHNVRSVHNVGSIFRTADAAGVSKIYLTGYTPTPIDRFGRERKDFAKISLGAERTVAFECCRNIGELIKRLKSRKVRCVAVEQTRGSIDYRKVRAKQNTAFLFGNEVSGLPLSLLKQCDFVVEIPMCGKLARNRFPNDGVKESLNVAVAVGVVLFQNSVD